MVSHPGGLRRFLVDVDKEEERRAHKMAAVFRAGASEGAGELVRSLADKTPNVGARERSPRGGDHPAAGPETGQGIGAPHAGHGAVDGIR